MKRKIPALLLALLLVFSAALPAGAAGYRCAVRSWPPDCWKQFFCDRFGSDEVTEILPARAKNIYDRLVQSDVVEFLYNNHNYDWAIAADVLGYIGDLKEFAAAVSGIKLIFTTELYDGTEAYKVMPNGRYKHRQDYVENLLRDNGYTKISCKKMVLRKEDGKDVNGILWKAENV